MLHLCLCMSFGRGARANAGAQQLHLSYDCGDDRSWRRHNTECVLVMYQRSTEAPVSKAICYTQLQGFIVEVISTYSTEHLPAQIYKWRLVKKARHKNNTVAICASTNNTDTQRRKKEAGVCIPPSHWHRTGLGGGGRP